MASSFRAPGSTFGNYPGALYFPSVVETYAPSAAGNTAAAAVASSRYAQPVTTLLVAPTAGVGTYTYVIYFAIANRIAGDSVVVKYTAPASTNPTVEFRNAASDGTLLLTANPAASFVGSAEFVYTGTAWVLLRSGAINSTLGSVTTGAGSFTTLAASGAVTASTTLAVTDWQPDCAITTWAEESDFTDVYQAHAALARASRVRHHLAAIAADEQLWAAVGSALS